MDSIRPQNDDPLSRVPVDQEHESPTASPKHDAGMDFELRESRMPLENSPVLYPKEALEMAGRTVEGAEAFKHQTPASDSTADDINGRRDWKQNMAFPSANMLNMGSPQKLLRLSAYERGIERGVEEIERGVDELSRRVLRKKYNVFSSVFGLGRRAIALDQEDYDVTNFYYDTGYAQKLARSENVGNVTLAIICLKTV
eukprot:gnl/TRDRNA2_/TRDRNA2_173881_c1_seq2.p1 gnl/TRDRNA2_/TRDRNA2_173881_c1~~gnl/TRDRNA2_/TRDRNA2_173881_c1_seq2.p1  ORF type:complete len:199 (-),score=26.61 gnl/TRDRNA2_/TRDRNA2_173881_c1_seq2:154-750(-)